MKIGVCAKVTPDAEARIKINGDASGIDPAGVKMVVSDYDEYAVEEAIKTKEANGGEVVVFTVGDKSSDRLVRGEALARGADKAIIVSDDEAKAEKKRRKEAYAERDETRRVQAEIDRNRKSNKAGLDQIPHVLHEVELSTQERRVERA